MAKCYKCGNTYYGWSCPTCSVEKELKKVTKELQKITKKDSLEKWWEEYQRDFKEYQEREWEKQRELEKEAAREEFEMRETDYALEEQRRLRREGWRLEADSKADKAYELYKAGLYEDAIKICLETISQQDPSNIKLYRFAAWSFENLGDDTRVRELLKKQISLLRTIDYRYSERDALRVLQDILGIEKNEDLMQSFEEATSEIKYFPSALLDELIKHSFYDSAQKLYLNTVKYSETFLGHAYGIELNNKVQKKQDTDRLTKHLKDIPYTQRNNVFEAFKNINSSAKFSEETMQLIQKEIRKRYNDWAPEIKRELEERATKLAKEEVDRKRNPAVIGWIVAIIILIILWGPVGWFKSLFVAIAARIIISLVIRSKIQGNIKAKLITSLSEDEENILNSALLAKDLPPSALEEAKIVKPMLNMGSPVAYLEEYQKRAGMSFKTKIILVAIFLLLILVLFGPKLMKEIISVSKDIFQAESPQQKEIANPVPLYRETEETITEQKITIPLSVPLVGLIEAKQKIPGILERIYHDLSQGNPRASSSFLESEILSNSRLLDTICKPFTYRAHYIENIIERPENKFEVRIRVLLKPIEESAQVMTFRVKDDSLVLENVSSYLEDWFSTWKEEAIEVSRNFYYALKADKQDVIKNLVSSPEVIYPKITTPFRYNRSYRDFQIKLKSSGEIGAIYCKITSYKGLKARVDFGSYLVPDWVFYVDNIDGEYKIIEWHFRDPTGRDWEAYGSDPNIESYTLKRFESKKKEITSQVEAIIPEKEKEQSLDEKMAVLNEKEKQEPEGKKRILEDIERKKKSEEEQIINTEEEIEERKPVRAIGKIKPPKLIKRIEPIYPTIAIEKRVEGVVILEVTTDIYGKVKNIKVLRSIPLLDQAAIDAVRQWEYEPAFIDGKPRGVIFTATVFFKLPN